ncbi:uncharacterized protein LOC122400277 [Colletes gigas]|uniref:uncharacterized protein LOC122400277 n=1 Tax=Colletes gigas TaxID=935657 RepID=UPI001C9B99E5|nr:uncharacterized protein LOC122400277 [Colletes gigas]
MDNFKPPVGLDLKDNAANNLKNFKQRFEIFVTAISEKEIKETRRVAMLLNCIGEDALDVFNTFGLLAESLTTKSIFEKFEEYVKPRVNIIIERHKFHTRRQQVNEPFDSFLTDLRKLRTKLPMVKKLLKPKIRTVIHALRDKQRVKKMYYDRGAKERKEFKIGDTVVVRNKTEWEPAVITEICKKPRSYFLRNKRGNTIRRNSYHIKKSVNSASDVTDINIEDEITLCEEKDKKDISDKNNIITRSGRIVRRPAYFNIT